jgi:hypothetical protein
LLPDSIYEERYREATLTSKGVGIYGTLPGHLDYQLVYGVLTIPSDGGVVQFIEQSFPGTNIDDIDVDPGFTGELFWDTPLEGLRVGYTYTEVEFELTVNRVLLVPAEVEYNIFSVEYTYENFMISAEFNDSETIYAGDKEDGELYYVMTTYRFTGWFELGLYYSVSYPDKDDKNGKEAEAAGDPKETTYLKDFALSTRFDVNEFWTVKLEFHLMDGLSGVNYSESDDPNDPDPDWTLFAAKVSYSF